MYTKDFVVKKTLLETCMEADLQDILGEIGQWEVLKKDTIGPNWKRM